MIIGSEDEKYQTLNPTPNLLENPICDEQSYLDSWCTSVSTASTQESHIPCSSAPSWSTASTTLKSSFDESHSWNTDSQTKSSNDREPQSSWKTKHPEQWTSEDVTLWICSLITGYQVAINVAPFLNLTGAELSRMSCAELQNRDPQSGIVVHMALQNVLAQMAIHNFNNQNSSSTEPTYTQMELAEPFKDESNRTALNDMRYPPAIGDDASKGTAAQKLSSLDLKLISFDIDDKFDSIYKSLMDSNAPDHLKNMFRAKQLPGMRWPCPQPIAPTVDTQIDGTSTPLTSPSTDGSRTPPQSKELQLQTGDELSQYGGFSDVKGNHLWEFIRDLLFDSRYNPSLVKWEDRQEGIFKFVKSDQVAKLWGRKKNNPAMTYEKLSRAMRYYYRRKILERIDGRRLVYKFGPMATGWKA